MENSSIYDAFERMWEHILIKFNAQTETLNSHTSNMENPHIVTKGQLDLDNVDNTADLDKPISNATQAALDGKADLEHVHNITKDQVGLGNVDNTSDLDKPISIATQGALDEKADEEHTHSSDDIIWFGPLEVECGGTGYDSIRDTTYTTPRYRASALVSYETTPYDNGTINWVYE